MLPTLAVILWAYGMYALFAFIFQRKGGTSRSHNHGRWFSGFVWMTFALGLGLFLWCCYSSNRQNQQLQLAGFLGTVYAEGLPGRVDKLEYPPAKTLQRPGEQPVYALLHPGTPDSQLEPERKLIRPRPARIVRKRHTTAVHEKSHKNAKVNKAGKHSARKDKRAAKSRSKKKKRSSALGRKQIHAG